MPQNHRHTKKQKHTNMTNKQIATAFSDLAKIMELHDENPFKIRSYNSAYLTLRKVEQPLPEMSDEEITALKGVGKTIAGKIRELVESGKMMTYEKYREITPPGVVDMLKVNGFGPKKIKVVWKELGAESIGELLYACNENRLVEIKGFGQKTQTELIKKLELFLNSQHKFHYGKIAPVQEAVLNYLEAALPTAKIAVVGDMIQLNPIVEYLDFLVVGSSPELDSGAKDIEKIFDDEHLIFDKKDQKGFYGKTDEGIPVRIFTCEEKEWGSKLFRYSSSSEFITAFLEKAKENSKADALDFKNLATEKGVFEKAGLPYILPELRYDDAALSLPTLDELIRPEDIRGVVHAHTTYSDGIHTLEQMVDEAKSLGYEYLTITDHSQAAFYANGLKPDRVLEQFAAIDKLNTQQKDFKIYKSIESDILNDGSLDYDEEILQQFDLIIASVHTNLKMDQDKATQRLITAIENPYTTILGHPTGRILLARSGYPIDHAKVIDACAANGVHLELNANPLRLDIDWTWIPYAREKGVLISINPDAHSKGGIQDIKYGALVARKGRLTKDGCLNARGREEFEKLIKK